MALRISAQKAPPAAAGPQPAFPAPPLPPRAVPMRRRRPGAILAGVAVTAVGVLSSAALYLSSGHRVAVLAVSEPIAYGQVITAADLVTVDISLDPAVSSIAAANQNTIVGKRAAAAIAPGSLIVPGDLSSAPLVPSGDTIVGLLLKPGQLPASTLHVGQGVDVVFTPGTYVNSGSSATGGSSAQAQLPTSVAATVTIVGAPDQTGDIVVDVAVSGTEGPSLAAQASTGDIAVISQVGGGI